jgi:hypothetical protein
MVQSTAVVVGTNTAKRPKSDPDRVLESGPGRHGATASPTGLLRIPRYADADQLTKRLIINQRKANRNV